jgi:ribosome modulation factor
MNTKGLQQKYPSEYTSQHGFSSNDFGSSEMCPFESLNVKQIFLFFKFVVKGQLLYIGT